MKKLLAAILIIQFIFIECPTTNAQFTKPILKINSIAHTDEIEEVSTDAKGEYILTVSRDKTAKLWSASDGDLIRTFRPPISKGNFGILLAGAISPNGEIVAVGGATNGIYIFNALTGKLIQRLFDFGGTIQDIEFSKDGKYLAASFGGTTGVFIYKKEAMISSSDIKEANFSMLKKLTGYGQITPSIAFDNTGKFASSCFDGKIRLYDRFFNLIGSTVGAGNKPYSLAFSPDGNKLSVGYMDAPDIEVYSARTLALLYKPSLDGENAAYGFGLALAFSADGEFLYGGGQNTKKINGEYWRFMRRWSNSGQGSYVDYPGFKQNSLTTDIKPLPNGDLIIAQSQHVFGRKDRNGNTVFYKTGTVNNFFLEKHQLSINYTGDQIAFTPKGSEAMLFSIANRKLKMQGGNPTSGLLTATDYKPGVSVTGWMDNKNTKINGVNVGLTGMCRTADIAPANDKVVLGGDKFILCTDVYGNKLWNMLISGTAWAVNISGNGKVVVVLEDGGLINWYRMDDGKLLFSLYADQNGKSWILYTHNGYFDSSSDAENLAGWNVNQGMDKEALMYPLSQFYDKFYTPNLGARLLAGEDLSDKESITSNFKLPPLVEILSPSNNFKSLSKTVTVKVSAQDQGGGVDEIRLYHNGKMVETTQRGFKFVGETKEFTITLINGANKIKATAYNTDRTEALPDQVVVHYEGAKKSANLHLLVIGVNEYKNPKYNLNYALQDATAFEKQMSSSATSIFGNINVTFIQDSETTRTRIIQEFDRLKETVGQEDVFVFYYAGHGVMSIDDKSQFYLVPNDVTRLYGDNITLGAKAISANELQQFSAELKAQKQLFVFDACQSGGMTEMLAMRGAAEEKAIAQLARSTGTYWLTASGSEQFATEFAALGHGVFTYTILEGLTGSADGGSKDGKITVKELSAYLDERVPELSEKYKGTPQYPTIYGYGQDFPLVIIK